MIKLLLYFFHALMAQIMNSAITEYILEAEDGLVSKIIIIKPIACDRMRIRHAIVFDKNITHYREELIDHSTRCNITFIVVEFNEKDATSFYETVIKTIKAVDFIKLTYKIDHFSFISFGKRCNMIMFYMFIVSFFYSDMVENAGINKIHKNITGKENTLMSKENLENYFPRQIIFISKDPIEYQIGLDLFLGVIKVCSPTENKGEVEDYLYSIIKEKTKIVAVFDVNERCSNRLTYAKTDLSILNIKLMPASIVPYENKIYEHWTDKLKFIDLY